MQNVYLPRDVSAPAPMEKATSSQLLHMKWTEMDYSALVAYFKQACVWTTKCIFKSDG